MKRKILSTMVMLCLFMVVLLPTMAFATEGETRTKLKVSKEGNDTNAAQVNSQEDFQYLSAALEYAKGHETVNTIEVETNLNENSRDYH